MVGAARWTGQRWSVVSGHVVTWSLLRLVLQSSSQHRANLLICRPTLSTVCRHLHNQRLRVPGMEIERQQHKNNKMTEGS